MQLFIPRYNFLIFEDKIIPMNNFEAKIKMIFFIKFPLKLNIGVIYIHVKINAIPGNFSLIYNVSTLLMSI